MRIKDGEVIKTVGELKKALADIPNETPLAFDDMGLGYGMAKPYIATHGYYGEHSGYYRKDDKKNASNCYLLPQPHCIIESAI